MKKNKHKLARELHFFFSTNGANLPDPVYDGENKSQMYLLENVHTINMDNNQLS